MKMLKKLFNLLFNKNKKNYFFYDDNPTCGNKSDVKSYFANQYGLNVIERKLIETPIDFNEMV
jgi:hypothetical protein